MSFLLLPLLAILSAGDEVRISNVDEFIQFKNNVNSGTNYEGTTVFLDSDLSLDEKTPEPIGTSSNSFRGVFDGQGHMISNLAMSPSSEYAGLFGYSNGLTIRNIILDSSCSITKSLSKSGWSSLGGIIGYCDANLDHCTLENSVNMGSVSFSGNIDNEVDLGGIAGYLYSSSSYSSVVKNCANYGDVTHFGVSKNSYIGGVAGYSYGSSLNEVHIYNSLNYGTVMHSGTTSDKLYLGGIVGETYYTTIENCVSAGKIESIGTTNYNYIGSVVGEIFIDTPIRYCYTTSELSNYDESGGYSQSSRSSTLSYDSNIFELNGTVSVGSYTGASLIDAINAYADYYSLRYYSHWLLNKDKKAVTFTINNDRTVPISMNYQIVLLPSLASEGNMGFDGWYKNNELTTPFTSYEVTGDTELYGKWEVNTNSYTITFDTRREGIFFAPVTAQFGSVVSLPNTSITDDCVVGFWETEYNEKLISNSIILTRNIILYAVWKCMHIKTPEDLVDVARIVNSGVDTFEGMTVFLDSDLDFAGKAFEPIGRDQSNYFRGVFDGQGHVISNIKMNSFSQYAGLFGYSWKSTIRNIILDSSCSVTSSFSGSDSAYLGGIIGDFSGSRTIENSVNMASVSFTENVSSNYLYLGGIVGYLYSYSYNSIVKNCANYGDVTHSGVSGYSYIGGIVGYSSVHSSSYRVLIKNSLNYGTITHSETTLNELNIGGIVGFSLIGITIENCVSAGKITMPTNASYGSYIGSIAGYTVFDTFVHYCYITSELSSYSKYGHKDETPVESYTISYNSTTFELDETVSIGSYKGISLIDALNTAADYYANYSHWLLNRNKNTLTFTINGRTAPVKMSYQIMVMPSLASEGTITFGGWYEDNSLTKPFTSYEIASNIALYGEFCAPDFTVSFDVNGEYELVVEDMAIIGCEGTYGELPEPAVIGYTFDGWFTSARMGDKVESGGNVITYSNHILYAHWTINNYVVTFDFGNGTTSSGVLTYDEIIEYPDNIPDREDFIFTGWDPNPERMPTENITIKAQWEAINPSGCVKVVFSEKNLAMDKVRDAIKEFAPEGKEFTFVTFEIDFEETKTVVKFKNKEIAKAFIENVRTSSDAKKSGIKTVGFVPGGCSFSAALALSTLIYFMMYLFTF